MAEWRALERNVTLLIARVRELSTKQSTGSSAALLVRINELEAATEQLQKSNRREFGKLWKLIALADEPPPPVKRDTINGHVDLQDIDPELAAEIELQTAPPKAPGVQ